MKCCICEKEMEVRKDEKGEIIWDKGNNAQPVKDGRCCDECNLKYVIPARMKKEYMHDLKINQTQTFQSPIGQINNDEVFFKSFGIKDNDRLRNYQLVKSYWTTKMTSQIDEEDFIKKEQIAMLKAMWKSSFMACMEEAKVFTIEDEVIPLLLHTECNDGNLPFNSVFIDAKVQIKNRTYFGFHIGSYYTEKTQYRAILTAYSKYIKHKGEMVKFIIPGFILLKQSNDEEPLPFRKDDYYHKKIRNFVFSFCNFVNEPDVSVSIFPKNPKNNVRRVERGNMPLPEYRNVIIHGKLRMYVDNQKKEWQGGTHAPVGYRYWVRGFYRHFFDKERYANLYALDNDSQRKAGLTFSEKHKDTLRTWVKPFIRGQGILIKQSWEVTK